MQTLTTPKTPDISPTAATSQGSKAVQVMNDDPEHIPPPTPESMVFRTSSCEASFHSSTSETENLEVYPLVKNEEDGKDVAIKKEEVDSVPSKSDEKIAPAEIFEAYNNLFLIYYTKTPNIDTNNIDKALCQAELLVQTAGLYGSTPLVRTYLSNCLMQYGRDLYKAILKDPPRWLQLSTYLESGPIFKEAVIHIVGSFPHWPWKTVQQKHLPDDIHAIIQTKLENLQTLKTKIDKTLFMSSIRVGGQELRLSEHDLSTFDTWFMVQLWRDWFCHSLARAKASRDRDNGRCTDGTMYRAMFKGGDVYLPIGSVFTILSAFRGRDFAKWNLQEVEEDLRLMKEFAQREVKPLCVNNSMLAVEEEGIEYFTCTKVENDELPWLKQDGGH